ncbi:hypothetical protein KR222_006970 [Zaprionus bogoriensis]|nr:hypothetical protein KR222_006970 [Zaprionus bogoriensis]
MQQYLKLAFVVLCTLTSTKLTRSALRPQLVRIIPTVQEDNKYVPIGYEVDSNDLSYLVALEFTGKTVLRYWFCAGSILTHRWILTVASCTNPAIRVKISYGVAQRRQPLHQIRVARRCMFEHPDFNPLYANDIALIHTPYVPFSVRVGAVPYENPGATSGRFWAYTSGWGQHRDTKKYMNQLHLMQIQLMGEQYCQNQGFGKRFRAGMLCARLPNMDSSCGLDSGSPLVLRARSGLLGLASFGSSEHCRNNTLLSYTNIKAYTQWINSVMLANK